MTETVYTGIARLVDQGASLDELESYIEVRNRWSGEDDRSAAWLRDWVAWEKIDRGELVASAPGPDLL